MESISVTLPEKKFTAFYNYLGLMLICVAFLTGCKDKNGDPEPESISTTLSSKEWISSDVDAVVDGKTYSDKSMAGSSRTKFNADGSYSEYDIDTEATTKGMWTLSGKTLKVSYEGVILKGEITDISSTGITFAMPEVDISTIDLERDYSDIQATDPKFMDIYQVVLLLGLDFAGFDQNKLTLKSKFHIVYKFKS